MVFLEENLLFFVTEREKVVMNLDYLVFISVLLCWLKSLTRFKRIFPGNLLFLQVAYGRNFILCPRFAINLIQLIKRSS